MQFQGQYRNDPHSIIHSPYYGCTVRVVSKAHVSYEGILDGISTKKDRISLKNVRVKGNVVDQDKSFEDLGTLNTVMIDHLTNDMHIYEQVCLNVHDIQELVLLRLPSNFHETKTKLYALDPCLLDIRLSPCDEDARAHRSRHISIGSTGGGGALISSSSNESSSSFGYRSDEKFGDESTDESIGEQIKRLSRMYTTAPSPPVRTSAKPATLLVKKVLPKKVERNNVRPVFRENRQTNSGTTEMPKRLSLDNHRKSSPIRVTITSKLNPNAVPFYAHQQRSIPTVKNYSSVFPDQNRVRPMVSSNRASAIPTGRNAVHSSRQYHRRSYQRFVPPRQMVARLNFNMLPPPPPFPANYRMYYTSFSDRQIYATKPLKQRTFSHQQLPVFIHRPSSSVIMNQILSTPPIRQRLSVPGHNRPRPSSATLHATVSLPYQHGNSLQTLSSFRQPIGSRHGHRTVSGTSSGSSLSTDIGPHSIVQLDSTSSALTSTTGQYDFEKANEEFRRYLELEKLVTRRVSPTCSSGTPSDETFNQQVQSYKKEISFFDRISCTATTGTAVAYTEMDEVEKNRETFGDDALLISLESDDNEWQI